MPPPEGTVLETLRQGILAIFVERFHARVASADADLLEAKLVDSVKIIDLVLEIEQRFVVSLPFEELEIEDFRTVARLAERIQRTPPAAP
jgi:acyl carrier protein